MPERPAVSPGIHRLLSEYDNALSCIRCGQCLSVCPTYQLTFAEEESPRGRIALARALAEGSLPVTPDFVRHSLNCLLCEACTAICPAGFKMEPLGVAVREVIAEQAGGPRWRRGLRRALMDLTLGDMPRFRLLCRMAFVYQRSGARTLLRRSGLLRLLRLREAEALLPEMPRRFIVPKGQSWPPANAVSGDEAAAPATEAPARQPAPPTAATGRPRRVALFTGCIMSTAFAETTEATARTLARRGCEVVAVAGQGCCGALHLHSGEIEGARALALANLAAFNPEEFDAIVVNSAGCGSTLKGYAHLIRQPGDGHATAGEAEAGQRAEAFARKVRDITEELASLPSPPSPIGSAAAQVVTLQEPCHLAHAQRITAQPRRLLQAVAGVELREMDESALCCGSAGIYNVTHPETAAKLLNRKLDNAVATGATVIATANPGCLLQLRAGVEARGLAMQVEHIVDIIDAAERRGEG